MEYINHNIQQERVTTQINPTVRRKCKICGQKSNYGQGWLRIHKAQVQTKSVGQLVKKHIKSFKMRTAEH